MTDRAGLLVIRTSTFTIAAWLASCTATTHVDEYGIAPIPIDERLCAQCPDRPDLRHPPCPSEIPGPPGDQVLFFALRSLDVGTMASTWSTGYLVGLDQDCSDRPAGKPVLCNPRNPLTVFERLSNGVDNAFATQVIYPLIQSQQTDPQALINQSIEKGLGGLLLIVHGWNGLPDDDQVSVRLVPAVTALGGPPAWDGTDRWIAFADRYDPSLPGKNIPDTENKTDKAYVTGGTLVWDARALPTFLLPFGSEGALLDLRLTQVVMMGSLVADQSPRRLVDMTLAGAWSAFLASRQAIRLAEMVSNCDACEVERLTPYIEGLLAEAPDLLLPSSQGASICDAISVGFSGNYVEFEGVTNILPVSSIPKSCPNMEPCKPDS